MKFFIDTANLEEIKAAKELGVLDGVTTNPSLIAKIVGDPSSFTFQDFKAHIAGICEIVDGPVSAEVTCLETAEMIADIGDFLTRWLPGYLEDNRHYVTVAIGCTGGQHRSTYAVEQLAQRFRRQGFEHVLVRHRALQR